MLERDTTIILPANPTHLDVIYLYPMNITEPLAQVRIVIDPNNKPNRFTVVPFPVVFANRVSARYTLVYLDPIG
jgi:hypothetical protein